MSFAEVLVAIVGLCVVIIVHEFGHYIAAVRTGMKVDRFSVFGIGPAIIKLGTWRGTEFVIGAIPFGAYVLIRGMEPDEGEARLPDPDPRSPNFRDKPLWARAAVLAGGPIANYLFAIVMFTGVFAIAGMLGPHDRIVVSEFADESRAQAAGMLAGDEIVRVADLTIDPANNGRDVSQKGGELRGTTADVVVLRDGQEVTLSIDFNPDPGLSPMGISIAPPPRVDVDFGTALAQGAKFPFVTTGRQLEGLWMLITGQLRSGLSGPIGIVNEIAKSAALGPAEFLEMIALISTLLGMFNLLPLPALDGGRLTFLLFEGITRKRTNPRVEELVHGYGMLALLALMVFVTVGDVRRLL